MPKITIGIMMMHFLAYSSIVACMVLLLFAFHRSWLASTSRPAATMPTSAPIASQNALAVPPSTFPLDNNNPLAQIGLLRPQDPTDPNSFAPLPPVRGA